MRRPQRTTQCQQPRIKAMSTHAHTATPLLCVPTGARAYPVELTTCMVLGKPMFDTRQMFACGTLKCVHHLLTAPGHALRFLAFTCLFCPCCTGFTRQSQVLVNHGIRGFAFVHLERQRTRRAHDRHNIAGFGQIIAALVLCIQPMVQTKPRLAPIALEWQEICQRRGGWEGGVSKVTRRTGIEERETDRQTERERERHTHTDR
jgi:hypothetical protein